MLVNELTDSLQFNDYFVVADIIREIFLREHSASILEGQTRLPDCWNAAMLELYAETFLIHRLIKTAALIFVNFKAGANYGVARVLED